MTSSSKTAVTNEKKIVYMQNGERKTIPESQAIHMLDSIAQQDLPRALGYYLNLSNENPHAERLLESFYQTLFDMFMFEQLLELTSARLERIPSCTTSFSWKMNALQHMFRNHEAIDLLEAITQGNPDNVLSWNSLGRFQNDVGNFQDATACFNKAVEIKPSFAAAHWNRSAHSSNIDADLKAVKKLIASNEVDLKDTHYLHFTAYRYCEKLERYDDAFEHLQIANAMKRRTFDYDLSAELTIDENAKAVFNTELMQSLEKPDKSDLRPIFIMGMPRSGTTLVEQIIASHSNVAGGDEYTALANAIMQSQRQSDFNGQIDQWLATRNSDDWQKMGRIYEHNMRFVRGDKKVFTDKNQFNHRSIGIIQASLANAKIIVLDRNPMDVAFGCYRQLFGGQGGRFSYQLDELAQLYSSYMRLIDYWESVTDGLILRVQYEDLVQNQKTVTEQILQFCNLEPQHQCFEFYKTERTVKTLSASQVRQPMFTQGIERWKKYQTQLQPMLRELEKAGLVEC